jgi:3-oxoacyl-[acyl-carrier-protein] synthase III
MKASVLGLGQWLPETVRTNDAWPATFGTREAREAAEATDADRGLLTDVRAGQSGDLCDRITARYVALEAGDPFVGSKRRRVADDALTSVEAETLAGRAALDDAGVDAKDVGLILSWTVVPDRITPSGASRVAHNLGANKSLAMGVDAACASAIAQLALAAAMIESGRIRFALLTQSHLMTRAFPLGHPASPNVGDVATAIVVGATERPGIVATYAVSEGELYDAVAWRRSKENDTRWFEPGGASYLGSYAPDEARALMKNTVRIAADTVREMMQGARLPVDRIGALASVQPRKWVPSAIAEALGLPPAIAPSTFEDYAHLGGCGVVTNLIAARSSGLVGKGSLTALYAQGAGFTRAAALLELA